MRGSIKCFDGDVIFDTVFRISLVRNKNKGIANHAFLLLEGTAKTTFVNESTLSNDEDDNEEKPYRIMFMDFRTSDGSNGIIRILEADKLCSLPTRLIFSTDNFEKVSILVNRNQFFCIYNNAVRQQKIQEGEKDIVGYIHYAKDGGIPAACSTECDGKKRHNCLSWLMELLEENKVNIGKDFSLVQRTLLSFIALPLLALPDSQFSNLIKNSIYALTVVGVGIFAATRIHQVLNTELPQAPNPELERFLTGSLFRK